MWQPPSREAPNKAQNNFLDFSGCLALMPAQMQEPPAATVTMLLGPALGWVMGCRHCVPCSCLSSAQGSDELSGHLFAVQHHASSVLFFPMRLIPLKILLLHLYNLYIMNMIKIYPSWLNLECTGGYWSRSMKTFYLIYQAWQNLSVQPLCLCW